MGILIKTALMIIPTLFSEQDRTRKTSQDITEPILREGIRLMILAFVPTLYGEPLKMPVTPLKIW